MTTQILEPNQISLEEICRIEEEAKGLKPEEIEAKYDDIYKGKIPLGTPEILSADRAYDALTKLTVYYLGSSELLARGFRFLKGRKIRKLVEKLCWMSTTTYPYNRDEGPQRAQRANQEILAFLTNKGNLHLDRAREFIELSEPYRRRIRKTLVAKEVNDAYSAAGW